MYVAGTAPITLLWAAIASVGVGSRYAILTLATEFAERSLGEGPELAAARIGPPRLGIDCTGLETRAPFGV